MRGHNDHGDRADAPPAGQQFAGWTGDVQILADPAASTTTGTIPSMEVTITATYRELPVSVSCLVGASFGATRTSSRKG